MNKRQYDLKKDGVRMVTYPMDLKKSVKEAASLWQDFCKLPVSIKDQFAAADNQWTVGYEYKDGTGKNGDRKENFDYSQQKDQRFSKLASAVNNETATQFIKAAEALGEHAVSMIQEFGFMVEDEYGIEGFGEKAKASARSAFFRFLHYPSGQTSGGTIAEPHVDHSGFTFHLFETTDGCERLTFDGEWTSLPLAEGQAASFASMQTQFETNGEIKALAHRVLANDISAEAGRYAIVCFVALADTPTYNKAKYGRLQEMKPGFNYSMSPEEFSKLFK